MEKTLDGTYKVFQDDQCIGTLQLYDNPCHMKNCYVKPELEQLDARISAELFRELSQIAGRPLQVMVASEDTLLAAFLIAGGFQCKRKCYEVNARLEDYAGGSSDLPLMCCRVGEADYEAACQMMFHHYTATHEAVNPRTADYAAFCEKLPAMAVYEKAEDRIVSLAFVADDEIACVCSTDERHFSQFARSLASAMLAEYESIFFESDDCDWAGMMLRSLFVNQDETSFDTYVLEI